MAHRVPLTTTTDAESAVLPVHFSWMWESPLRITSHASGTFVNLRR